MSIAVMNIYIYILLGCGDELWYCGVMSEVCCDEGGEMSGVMSIAGVL